MQDLQKIKLIGMGSSGIVVEADFNPKEISFTKAVNWTGSADPLANIEAKQFNNGSNIEFTLQLLFDRYESRPQDVRPPINALLELATAKNDQPPPYVKVRWGAAGEILLDTDMYCVITSISTKYTLFTAEGIPCRATATVSLKQSSHFNGSPIDEKREDVTGGSAKEKPSREDAMKKGNDSLVSGGDPGKAIASFNASGAKSCSTPSNSDQKRADNTKNIWFNLNITVIR